MMAIYFNLPLINTLIFLMALCATYIETYTTICKSTAKKLTLATLHSY